MICIYRHAKIDVLAIFVPSYIYSLYRLLSVSHTTDDMIFQWDPSVPLVVDDNIELPQLALVKNYTADCEYEREPFENGTIVVVVFSVFFSCRSIFSFSLIMQALKCIQREISHVSKWYLC